MISLKITAKGSPDFAPEVSEVVGKIADAIPPAFQELTDESTPKGRLYRRKRITGRRTKALDKLGLKAASKTRSVIGYYFHRASAPGQMPAKDSGALYKSPRVLKRGRFIKTVKFSARHAGYVELIRPYALQTIERAVQKVANEIG